MNRWYAFSTWNFFFYEIVDAFSLNTTKDFPFMVVCTLLIVELNISFFVIVLIFLSMSQISKSRWSCWMMCHLCFNKKKWSILIIYSILSDENSHYRIFGIEVLFETACYHQYNYKGIKEIVNPEMHQLSGLHFDFELCKIVFSQSTQEWFSSFFVSSSLWFSEWKS